MPCDVIKYIFHISLQWYILTTSFSRNVGCFQFRYSVEGNILGPILLQQGMVTDFVPILADPIQQAICCNDVHSIAYGRTRGGSEIFVIIQHNHLRDESYQSRCLWEKGTINPLTVFISLNWFDMQEHILAYDQFANRDRLLTNKLMLQGFDNVLTEFRKFFGCYNELVCQYNLPLGQKLSDVFHTNC